MCLNFDPKTRGKNGKEFENLKKKIDSKIKEIFCEINLKIVEGYFLFQMKLELTISIIKKLLWN